LLGESNAYSKDSILKECLIRMSVDKIDKELQINSPYDSTLDGNVEISIHDHFHGEDRKW
jgi:hypothetical protein